MENKIYDIIIIGAGPAGMTAAIYAARAGKTVAIFDKDGYGGNIAKSPKVENIPGFVSISGADFVNNMYEQMISQPTVEHFIDEVALVTYKNRLFKVTAADNTNYLSLSVIIATGTKHRELNLNTKDVYYCVTCDGPFFKGKNVAVVGSGNSGATYALELATYCKNVYLLDITKNMCCETVLQERINNTANITWLPETTIRDVKNDKNNKLSSITASSNLTKPINCKAIFAAIGMEPQTKIFSNLVELDEKNFIKNSALAGLYVAGDCTNNKVKQVTTACAEGTIAAVNSINYLNILNVKK